MVAEDAFNLLMVEGLEGDGAATDAQGKLVNFLPSLLGSMTLQTMDLAWNKSKKV